MTQPVFKNPFVSSLPLVIGTGNGTLTVDRLTHFTINQTYTAICTAIAPFTVFKIIGSLDGPVGVAVVGTQFHDQDLKVFLTINQGPTLFAIGDTITFTVAQGTDLNQENIDIYDALSQKNFSAGLPENVGDLAGDDNLRFRVSALLANLIVQDLTFESLLSDEDGNDISIKYIDGVVLTKASLTLQDLRFDADVAGNAGNAISMEYEDWDPAVAATATIQGQLFEAVTPGAAGNLISVEYTTGAPTSTPVISSLGNAVTVQIQSGITTHAEIKTEVNADPVVSLFLTAVNNVVGTATAPDGPTFLTGGSDAVGAAGFEVVTVISNAIKVKLQSGVSTATQVKSALDGSVAAAALIDTVIVGTGTNAQTAPVSVTLLNGGLDAVGDPGNEIVTVSGRSITVQFQTGVNTAQNIHDAILANLSAAALVDVTISGTAGDAQSAPTSRHFLSGGTSGEVYTFNINELSAPLTFYEGSGSLLVDVLTVQGRSYFRDNAKFRRVVALDDIDAIVNGSGSAIPNAQARINEIVNIERQDRNAKLIKGGTWSNSMGTTLTFDAIAYVQIPGLSDDRNRIPLSQSPISLPSDGDVAYVELNRNAGSAYDLTVQVASVDALVADDDTFVIARRFGTSVLVGEDTLLKDGDAFELGTSGGSGGAGRAAIVQEIPAGSGSAFTLSKRPINSDSLLVFIDNLVIPNDQWAVAGLALTLDVALALGQSIYVAYVIDADIGLFQEVPTSLGAGVYGLSRSPKNKQTIFVFVNGFAVSADQWSFKQTAATDRITFGGSFIPSAGQDVYVVYIEENVLSASGFQEELSGVVDGVNDTFTLSGAPSSKDSILVFVNWLVIEDTKWSLIETDTAISVQFAAGSIPKAGQVPYVFYLTDSSIGSGGGAGTVEVAIVETRTLTVGEIAAKQLTLSDTPDDGTMLVLDYKNVGPQFYGDDFIVSGNVVDWSGLSLDGLLTDGDKLRILYFVTMVAASETSQVDTITLDAGDIAAKQVTLSATPSTPAYVLLDVKNIGPQIYGDDFTVSGNVLDWSGLGLDGLLVSGDKLRVLYFI